MNSYTISYPVAAIAVVVGITALLVTLGVFIGGQPFPLARLRGLAGAASGMRRQYRSVGGADCHGLRLNDLYNSFGCPTPTISPPCSMSWAFPTASATSLPPIRRQAGGAFPARGGGLGERPSTAGQGKDVHVVMVMNEAFSDLTDSPAFDYGEEDDPLSNLHALEADPHALSGHLVVPGFAGGTANTEFDVLTGIQTNALSASTTSSFRVVNRNLESLFRVFDADGYATSFFHPGDDWFYNRENVYRWLGAERTLFADEMEAVEYKGRWVTDDYMSDLITNELDSAVSAGELLFHYTTTIQNHMSYTADKYGEGYEFPPVPLTISVSDEVETMLRVYAEGVRDADAMLGRLVDTFSAQEEPVVLVYFETICLSGDNQLGYQALGLTQEADWDALRSYETPM